MHDIVPTWVGTTARQIARAVRRGDTSATQVVADHLDHIARADGELSAFRAVRGGEAIVEAEKVDEQEDLANLPLAGVPVAVKENTPVAGLATWHGSAAARTPVAEDDHEIVRRLRGAGAVVVGVTRMPELGLWASTDDATGVSRNPWQPSRTPGGSSGGAAAAVASGMVPIAHGNDGFGSIRIPAACCGLLGLKPGTDVVPRQLGAEDWFGMTENGILASCVVDAAIGFAVLAGRRVEKLVQPGRLRVAVSLTSPVAGVRADAANRDAVAAMSRRLAEAGHDVVGTALSYPTALGLQGLATWFAAAAEDGAAGRAGGRDLQPRTRRHVALGRWVQRRGYVRAADRAGWRERMIGFFADHGTDVLLTPALASVPPLATGWARRSWSANMWSNIRYAPYAAPWNMAGLPALVVPAGLRPDGLPVGVQLVGPPGSELLLLAVAGQLEMMAPWQRHAPSWPRVGSPVG
ncbi:amidase [Micromonospora sp. NBC_01813]|uniref:amidase n=1 Tax=Micromonospora sp. NBC_01813 TaxID=2975988 RepID=UPI002DDA2A27|nr:amidase family protein [Micromonospora sp. NBC_01813]WSA08364.1 amidase family protein [Micromonospora sp. NBC_01813]